MEVDKKVALWDPSEARLVKTAQDDTWFNEATGLNSEHKAFKNVADIYASAQTKQADGLRFKLQAVYVDLSSVSVLCLP